MTSAYQLLAFILGLLLAAIAIVDAKNWRIPDGLTSAVLATGLILATQQGVDGFVWAIESAICAFGDLIALRLSYFTSWAR